MSISMSICSCFFPSSRFWILRSSSFYKFYYSQWIDMLSDSSKYKPAGSHFIISIRLNFLYFIFFFLSFSSLRSSLLVVLFDSLSIVLHMHFRIFVHFTIHLQHWNWKIRFENIYLLVCGTNVILSLPLRDFFLTLTYSVVALILFRVSFYSLSQVQVLKKISLAFKCYRIGALLSAIYSIQQLAQNSLEL